MPCDGPLTAYYGADVNPETGRRPLVFDERKAHSPVPIRIPCGRCMGCRLERSRQWAVRCLHEKAMHLDSAFATLTYDQKNLPVNGSLVLSHLQQFMKKFRHRRPAGLRFFACGEYGETTERPHYHVLFLNTDFPDKKFYKVAPAGDLLFISAELDKCWGHGLCVVGAVTFESAAYVARYITKKITGDKAADHYKGRLPEFVVMSRRPGIGAAYFEKHHREMYVYDSVIFGGREVALSRFYDERMGRIDNLQLESIKRARRLEAQKMPREEKTNRRRVVREEVRRRKMELFKRNST